MVKLRLIAVIILLLLEVGLLWLVYPITLNEQLVTGSFVFFGLLGHVITGVILRRGRFDPTAGEGWLVLYAREIFWLMFGVGVVGEFWSFRLTIQLLIATWQSMPK